MIRRVQRAVTEAAISYIHTTYLDSAQPIAFNTPTRGRVLRSNTALGVYDSESARQQGCFLRMISIVEAYLDIISESLFHENVPTMHDLVRRLVEDAGLRASSTWNERKAAFSAYHKIQFGEFSRWSELDAGIEVRNSIAHGLGRLTHRQRGGNITSKLSQIGIVVQDGSVLISDANLMQCRDVCIDFINYLDGKLPSVRFSSPDLSGGVG